ncbi:MAG: outer membrane beta-barrel protein [Gammaproteobacteria bacterium]|nr:outer membrane beta-barrel protein [Gammaproteobacteria bacterium]
MNLAEHSKLIWSRIGVIVLSLVAVLAFEAHGQRYMGLNAPVMFVDDTESITGGSMASPIGMVPYSAQAATSHKTGFKLAGVAGYELQSGLRVEAELFLARAGLDELIYSAPSAGGNPIPVGQIDVPVTGTADHFGLLGNLMYDFDTGSDWIPFVGGGIGYMRIDQSDITYDQNALAQRIVDIQSQAAGQPSQPLPPGFVPEISDTANVFIWHLGAGIAYRVNDNLMLQSGYRFQAGDDLVFEGSNSFGTAHSESAMRIHFLEIGMRYRFQ